MNKRRRPPVGTKLQGMKKMMAMLTLGLISFIFMLAFISLAVIYHNEYRPIQIVCLVISILTITIAMISYFVNVRRDGMTGIPNVDWLYVFMIRKMFQKRLSEYTAIYINLKNFKYVNRIVDNDGGDLALIAFCKDINGFLLQGEIVARLGGDNFAAFVYKNRLDAFLNFIKERKVSIVKDGEQQKIPIYSRCGIYDIKQGDNIGHVMTNMSVALNFAKSGMTEDFAWFEPSMLEKVMAEKEILFHFRKAIQEKEFLVYYQPKVNLMDGTLVGAEALVRWRRDGKVIPPIAFIPALEKNGILGELDLYVFDKVCSDIREWGERRILPVQISSNFSKNQLKDERFYEKLLDIINKYQIDRKLIQVELTETADFERNGRLPEILKKFSQNDISVAIDDFGTGFSSLELLKNNSVEYVKLDKSFVDNICVCDGRNSDAYLMEDIIRMCYDLGKKVVCEGVETAEQKDLLKDMNANVIQGYLFDKPLEKTEFEKRLQGGRYTV